MLRAASVLTVIAPMPGKCPEESEGSSEIGSANCALGPRDRLYKPCAARGRGRRNEEAARGPPISGPAHRKAPPHRPSRRAGCRPSCRKMGDWPLSPERAMRAAPGRTEASAGCTSRTPRRAALGLGLPGLEESTRGVESPGDFPFPLPCLPSGHRSARSPQTSPLLCVPAPARRQPPGSRAVPRPDLHAPRVPARRAAALTQSAQQDGLAPFLRLRPLFVAGPEQGLEPSPSQRALHLAHDCGPRGAQRATATGEH